MGRAVISQWDGFFAGKLLEMSELVKIRSEHRPDILLDSFHIHAWFWTGA
jgi:hypothetical protein